MGTNQGRRHEFEGGVNALQVWGQYSKTLKLEKLRVHDPPDAVVAPHFVPTI